MDIRPIRNDEDLTWALQRIDALFNAPVDSREGDELDILAALVERYEDVHYPIPKATPLEMIKFFMEQNDRSQKDLAEVLGSRSRASEILSGKRKALSLEHIKRLHRAWHIPVACLIDLEAA